MHCIAYLVCVPERDLYGRSTRNVAGSHSQVACAREDGQLKLSN